MSAVVTLEILEWRPNITDEAREFATRTLEEGGVIRLPQLGFALLALERRFLSPTWSDGRAKNISLENEELKGAAGSAEDRRELAAMVARFAVAAAQLVTALFP